MKSAYELAMEKLGKESPVPKVTDDMKAELAKLDNLYQSKLAEREVFLGGKIAEAELAGDFEALEQRLLEAFDSDDRIPYVGERAGYYYNFWRDGEHARDEQPLSRARGRGEPRPLPAHARRRVPRRRLLAQGEDRHGLAQLQHA